MDPNFEQAHATFIDGHLARRNGERKGRLLRGHQYAEKLFLLHVWWPIFRSFDNLHPEYEVYDWNRKSQFLDFAFLTPFGRIGLECDGFQSHVKDMDREKFSYALNRDTFLAAMGWKMLHFSFDDVRDRPEVCRMLLQLAVGPILLGTKPVRSVDLAAKELLRFAWNMGKPIRPKDVSDHFDINFRTARKRLQSLVRKGWMNPVSKGADIRYYELKEGLLEHML